MSDLYRLIHQMHAMERDGALFGPTLNDYALWPVIRTRCWYQLTGVSPDPYQGSLWRRIRSRPQELLRGLAAGYAVMQRRRLRGTREPYFILSAEAYRSVRRADGWWDVYLDDIACHPRIRDRHIRCEVRAHALPLRPTVAPRHLFTDAQLVNQIWHGQFGRDPEPARRADELCALLRDKLLSIGCTPDEQTWKRFRRSCRQRARMFRRCMEWYAGLFDELQPRLLLLNDAYNQHGIIAAARARGMAVVELQHGDIQPYHPGYLWPIEAAPFRDRMPIPTHIGTYGPHWSRIILSTGFWRDEEIRPVGSVRLEWVANQVVRVRNPDEPLTVLFTTQEPVRAKALALWQETIALARSRGLHFKLRIKVHRAELGSIAEYRRLCAIDADVEVLSPYEGDTLAAIAKADVHVSAWSTCHFEALGLRVPTVVLSFPEMPELIRIPDNPLVRHAQDAKQLLGAIAGANCAIAATDDEPFFTPDALNNTVTWLERLLTSRAAAPVQDRVNR